MNLPVLLKRFALKCIGGIVIALILDGVWLASYMKPWWNSGYDDSFSLLTLRRTMVVFTFILILVRLIVLISLGMGYTHFEEGKDEFISSGIDYNTNGISS